MRGDSITERVREYIQQRIAVEDHGYATPCWIWQLSLSGGGYGQGHPPGASRVDRAHRFSYREYVGPIPDGLHLDHLCRVRDCCNPEHLEPVTPLENYQRAVPFNPGMGRQTHCQRGHEFTPENTKIIRGGRRCRECHRAWKREDYALHGRSVGPPKAPHTHCKRGHELTPENTIVWKDCRRCRQCNIAWRAAEDDHRARFRAAKSRKAAAHRKAGGRDLHSGQQPTRTQTGDIAHRGTVL